MTNDTAYYLAFQKIGIGYRTLHNLLERFSSPDRAWNAPREELMRADASTLFIEKFIAERNLIDVEKLYAQSKFSDALPLTVADPRYPALLLETHSPPLVLFVRGSIDALNTRCCAVVGTRKPTPYGIAATHRIVEPLAQRGVTIVSGLAYGIDAEAHCAALNAKGATIAVLAVQLGNCLGGLGLGAHLHKAKSTGLVREAVHDEIAAHHGSAGREQRVQSALRRIERQISHVNIHLSLLEFSNKSLGTSPIFSSEISSAGLPFRAGFLDQSASLTSG